MTDFSYSCFICTSEKKTEILAEREKAAAGTAFLTLDSDGSDR
jgi:hypothetical protein